MKHPYLERHIDTGESFEDQLIYWYFLHLNSDNPFLSGEMYDNGSRYSPICLIPYMWELQGDGQSLRAYKNCSISHPKYHFYKQDEIGQTISVDIIKEWNKRSATLLKNKSNWCHPNEDTTSDYNYHPDGEI